MHSLGISQSYNPHKTPGIKVLQSFRFWFSLWYIWRVQMKILCEKNLFYINNFIEFQYSYFPKALTPIIFFQSE